jgi:hypothetical protein
MAGLTLAQRDNIMDRINASGRFAATDLCDYLVVLRTNCKTLREHNERLDTYLTNWVERNPRAVPVSPV